jgi:hypothetical protein
MKAISEIGDGLINNTKLKYYVITYHTDPLLQRKRYFLLIINERYQKLA